MQLKTVVLLIIVLCFGTQAQTIQYNEELLVNSSTSYLEYPCISGLSDSGYVITWEGWDMSDGTPDIYVQEYNDDGTKRGAVFEANIVTSSGPVLPSISGLSDGGYVISWQSWDQDSVKIFGQIFNIYGTKRGEEILVSTYPPWYPEVNTCTSGLSDGGFVISWESESEEIEGINIFCQIYNTDGTRRGEQFRANSGAQYCHRPSVCGLSGGDFVLCWESEYQDGDESGIFGQLYNRIGTKIGGEFQINSFTQASQFYPSVSALSDGGFVVAWSSDSKEGDNDLGVYAQIYEQNGDKRGSEFRVNTYTAMDQFLSDTGSLIGGGFVVCWQSYLQDVSRFGIYGQMFDNNGNKRGKEFQINSYINGDQDFVNVCGLSNGNLVVCWESNPQDRIGFGIYAKYFLGSPILHVLASFSLNNPEFDETLEYATVAFQWQSASKTHVNLPWELEYKLYIDTSEDFSNPQIYSDIYDTTFTVKELTPGQTYFWKVLAKNIEGDSLWGSESFGFYVSPAANIKDDQILKPETYILYPNFPNPFNPTTVISYQLPIISDVELSIFNILGHKVATLVNRPQHAGYHKIEWDASGFASGVYYYQLRTKARFIQTQKMVLLR